MAALKGVKKQRLTRDRTDCGFKLAIRQVESKWDCFNGFAVSGPYLHPRTTTHTHTGTRAPRSFLRSMSLRCAWSKLFIHYHDFQRAVKSARKGCDRYVSRWMKQTHQSFNEFLIVSLIYYSHTSHISTAQYAPN